MRAIFNETDHSYTLGDKNLISVTQLLRKHGLSVDYGNAPEETLRLASERGTLIHKEIEEYIKRGAIGFTQELSDFIFYERTYQLSECKSEVIVNNDIVAGTCDLMARDNQRMARLLIDIKTCSKIDKRAYAWQLSLYEYLSGEMFDKLIVLHLHDGMREIEVERIPREEIEKLLECERKGELYSKPTISLSQADMIRVSVLHQRLMSLQREKEAIERVQEQFRNSLKRAMEKAGITTAEFETFKATYIPCGTRETIDVKRLKAEKPEIYEEYKRVSETASSVRISVREYGGTDL